MLTKGDGKIEDVHFESVDGQVTGMAVTVNFAVLDGDREITRVRKDYDAWASRSAEQKAAIQALYSVINAEALASNG